jgi:uroporphyrinogen decarboxylase
MTGDRLLRAYRRLPVDRTPVWFMRQAGRSLPEYRKIRRRASLLEITRDPALCAEVTLQPVRRLGVDGAILFADITSPLPGLGVALEIVDGVGPVIDPPVRTPADIDRLPAQVDLEPIAPTLEAIALLARESPVPLLGFAGAPFTMASYLVEGRSARDAVRVKQLMAAEPEAFDRLMTRLVDLTIAYLGAQVAAGAAAVQVFDSWVGALSPRAYETAVAPHDRRLFTALEALGVPTIHFGTGNAGFLAAFAAAGGTVLGLDWRVDLGAGWSAAPTLAVQGNLDPALLLGGWRPVEQGARAILQAAAARPGHVFNLGHGVLPETDPDVLRRLVDLVHEASAPVATSVGDGAAADADSLDADARDIEGAMA